MKVYVFTISGLATIVCWYFILRSDDPWFAKVLSMIVSMLPILGPFFYLTLFHNTPDVKPADKQAGMSHWLGPYRRRKNYDPVFPQQDRKRNRD